MTDQESEAIRRAEEVKHFLTTEGGNLVRQILEARIDVVMNEARAQSAERTIGALLALHDAISAIYGCVSLGEKIRARVQRVAEAEVKHVRREPRIHGNPVPGGRTTDGV